MNRITICLTIITIFISFLYCSSDNGVNPKTTSGSEIKTGTLYFKSSPQKINKINVIPLGGTPKGSKLSQIDSVLKISMDYDTISSSIYVSMESNTKLINLDDLIFLSNLKLDSLFLINSCLPDSVYFKLL
jgi:hypothetical protein